jgi:POT family proton-dependent oligopeptide transporter
MTYALHHGAGRGGLLCGMSAAGFSLGGLKACVPPFMGLAIPPNDIQHRPNPSAAEQYTESKLRVKTVKNKRRVIVDRSLSLQSIYSLWYW